MVPHPPAAPGPTAHPRGRARLIAALAGIVLLQGVVATLSVDILSAVRAYVTGESLYSKGQKDAQIDLLDYVARHDEVDYRAFVQALSAPLGDRAAREALQRRPPDTAAATRGFLAGGNDPADVPGMIRLFAWFQGVPFMAAAIDIWTRADGVVDELRGLAEAAHRRLARGEPAAAALAELEARAPWLNRQLTLLEREFSARLSTAARASQQALLGANLALAMLLASVGYVLVRRSRRAQAAAQAELQRRQETLQRLLDSTAEGLYGVDLQGRCTFVNRAALALLGYADEAELVGQPIHALIHHSHADGRAYPGTECRMYQAYRIGRPVHVDDEVFWRRDGSAFPVEYWAHPVLDDGRIQGAVATFFDLTERHRMQAALREGAARLERLVDSVTDAVVSFDAEGRIVLFNRAAERVFRLAAVQAIGLPVAGFLPQPLDPAPTAPDAPDDGDAPAPPSLHELTGRRADGEEFQLEASLSRLRTEGGLLTTAVLRDAADLRAARAERRARETLEAASRAKTEFLSRMSHELRTPLNAVLGFAQLMRSDAAHPLAGAQPARVRHIEQAGAHLLALVNDVLDLSRVEAGQMALSLEPVNLDAVTEESAAMVAALARERGVTVHLATAGSAPAWVRADHVRLRQVIVNLLTNAVKYNRAGGDVTLRWSERAAACELTVADTGRGMSAEQLAHLFEPFNRLGAEGSSIEGTGIGLVLSRRLTELMGGALEVASRTGQGTVATLRLQCALALAPAAAAAPPSRPGVLDGARLDLLYAEDNEVNVELVRQVVALRPAITLRVAESGQRALELARRQPPQLMLVDMHLGDMTGLELAGLLRDDPATAGVRLVALSADALPEQIAAALARGFEAYLTKPIDFRALLDLLDGRELR